MIGTTMRMIWRAGIAFLILGFGPRDLSASPGEHCPRVGDTPPPLLLAELVQGPAADQVSWGSLNGKVVVLEFWSMSCGPCLQAIPHWNELVAGFKTKPVVFLCISNDNRDALKRFLAHKPISGWLALDQPFTPTEVGFGVTAIPSTVVVDRSGKIVAITHPTSINVQDLDDILEGKPSTLPPDVHSTPPPSEWSTTQVSVPASVEVSIEGPFPQPNGAYGFRGWDTPSMFKARKCSLEDALVSFFDVSPNLVFGRQNLPDGLYDIIAAGPVDQLPKVRNKLVEDLAAKFGIVVAIAERPIDVYTLSFGSSRAPGLRRPQKTVQVGSGGIAGGFYVSNGNMKGIAGLLEEALGKPVVDETGLDGNWDADLKWEMSESELEPQREGSGHANPGKVIKAVREQLGLELTQAQRQLNVLVVEKRKG